MIHSDTVTIEAKGVRSLSWQGDVLVDWASGVRRYGLDGTVTGPRYTSYGASFDAALTLPSGRYAALYQRLGTKALLLDEGGHVVREVDRSFYHAEAYEYPIALFELPDGRPVVAHCPTDYNRLEIDDVATGERLTRRPDARGSDYFHSRLAANGSGTRLLSAGWVWHPFDMISTYDVEAALADPTSLDHTRALDHASGEQNEAAFLADDLLVIASSRDADDLNDDEPPESLRLTPGTIGRYDVSRALWLSVAPLEEEAGRLMPVGCDHVVGFFESPKLIEIATGRVVQRWPELKTGRQNGPIQWHMPGPPPMAADPIRRRFAVAGDGGITVVTIRLDARADA